MKNLLLTLLIIVALCGCNSQKNVVSKKSKETRIVSVLTEENKRKFDYFFFEGQRVKMKGELNKAKNYFVECLKIDSLSATCFYELANIAIAEQNYPAAQQLLSNSVRLAPDNKWYQILLGDLYQQNKDYESAIAVYEGLTKRFPESDEYNYVLAQLYYTNKQFNKAIDAYNRLEKSIGINEVISIEKEKIYLEMGKQGLAHKEIEKLIEENPFEPRYYGFMGDLYLYNKEYNKAEQSYRRILSIDPANGLGYFSIANVKLQQKDTLAFFNNFAQGLEDKELEIEVKIQRLLPILMGKQFTTYKDTAAIQALFARLTRIHSDDARSYLYYANYLQNNNNKAKALEQYKKALTHDPDNRGVWQDMFFLEIDLGKFDMLYADASEALILFPDEPLFSLFYAMGAIQKEDYDKAKNALLKGLQYVDKNPALKGQMYAYLGDVQHSLGNKEEAFDNYEKALKIDENNVVVLNNYSYYLSLESKDLEKAEKMISKSIALEPGNATYLDTYAWVLFKRGRYFEAKYIIERAIDNGGNESEVIVEHYGDILYKNNDIEGAVKQWKKSIEMGNTSPLIPKKIELKKYVEE
ncbi:Tetratricopeptide repeat-containing protein [Saccharicrinis carchari]|uniref:Tetratricopeptide repeat-containing protein n=1 Tax=Saccharicrinis carchari TaxID=1168039 RepID=A0A521CIT6_SACCC|nr:tetratricopeptide repeat protein [Saccharicrinis carchari]SMO58610.1 Tetratricopeptide repeat-containing protein [Saccharicrinis carchari]